MFEGHALFGAGAAIVQKAQNRLQSLLAEHGVSGLSELPRDEAAAIQLKAVSDVAPHFSAAELEQLGHSVRSMWRPAFIPALERVSIAMTFPSDWFTMARGVDAAVVLAGFGLPVAPFDLAKARILAEPSNDIDTVTAQFARWKGGYVGYNVCAAPFYVLLTDCLRTLVQKVPVHPELGQVKHLFERAGIPLPQDPGETFTPGIAIFARQPGDRISTTGLGDRRPGVGTIVLYAGWEIDGKAHGAPNDGYLPVPVQLLRGVVNDSVVAHALARPVGAPAIVH